MAEVIELTYRGAKYECQLPERTIESDENIGETITLTYRSQKYEYQLTQRSAKQLLLDNDMGEKIKLVYRSQEYEYVMKNPTFSRQPQAIHQKIG